MLALLLSPTGLAILDVPDDYPEIRVSAPTPYAIAFNRECDPRRPTRQERVFRRIGRSHSYEEVTYAAP